MAPRLHSSEMPQSPCSTSHPVSYKTTLTGRAEFQGSQWGLPPPGGRGPLLSFLPVESPDGGLSMDSTGEKVDTGVG